jgi:hypothetical protein
VTHVFLCSPSSSPVNRGPGPAPPPPALSRRAGGSGRRWANPAPGVEAGWELEGPGLQVSGMPQECFRWGWGAGGQQAQPPPGPRDGALGAGQHVLAGGGGARAAGGKMPEAKSGFKGEGAGLGLPAWRWALEPPSALLPAPRPGEMQLLRSARAAPGGERKSQRGGRSAGRSGRWGRGSCPFVCNHVGGGAGWKLAAPSIFVSRDRARA